MEQYKRRNFTTESLNTQICGINQPWLRSLLHKGRTCMKGPSFWCSASSSVKYWLELKWIKNIRLEINWSQIHICYWKSELFTTNGRRRIIPYIYIPINIKIASHVYVWWIGPLGCRCWKLIVHIRHQLYKDMGVAQEKDFREKLNSKATRKKKEFLGLRFGVV